MLQRGMLGEVWPRGCLLHLNLSMAIELDVYVRHIELLGTRVSFTQYSISCKQMKRNAWVL